MPQPAPAFLLRADRASPVAPADAIAAVIRHRACLNSDRAGMSQPNSPPSPATATAALGRPLSASATSCPNRSSPPRPGTSGRTPSQTAAPTSPQLTPDAVGRRRVALQQARDARLQLRAWGSPTGQTTLWRFKKWLLGKTCDIS